MTKSRRIETGERDEGEGDMHRQTRDSEGFYFPDLSE